MIHHNANKYVAKVLVYSARSISITDLNPKSSIVCSDIFFRSSFIIKLLPTTSLKVCYQITYVCVFVCTYRVSHKIRPNSSRYFHSINLPNHHWVDRSEVGIKKKILRKKGRKHAFDEEKLRF